METEIRLNVSHLEPCEPLERVLAALDELSPGQFIRMLHNREPFPLYQILDNRGFEHRTFEGSETAFEICIWHRDDPQAKNNFLKFSQSLNRA